MPRLKEMMMLILDSSEIREAIALASSLTTELNMFEPCPAQTPDNVMPPVQSTPPPQPAPTPKKVREKAIELGEQIDPNELAYRGDKLEQVIKNMCLRSQFSGAVVTDETGLPFAVVNPPVSVEAVSAFTSVLGGALERAGSLLGHHGAEYLSIDVNYEEKSILRRFLINDTPYYLLAVCPQDVDERSEIEISIDQIASILGKE